MVRKHWITGSTLLVALLGLGLAACIDPIDLDVGPPENRLVVEGLLTEGPGPHTVRMTRSGAFRRGIDALRPAEVGALLIIEDGDGEEYPLQELGHGQYATLPGQLVGQPGERYRLRIALASGEVYQTEFAEMRAAPEIADVYTDLEISLTLVNGVAVEVPEMVLYVDAARNESPTYYRWTWSGHYQVYTCLGLSCETCYVPAEGRSLVEIGDDGLVTGQVLPEQHVATFPLRDQGIRFLRGYHLEVEQQSLTQDAYLFWSMIRDARDNVGGLFDPPADAAIGNVRNVDDATDYALGYFTVAGTSSGATCSRLGDHPDRPPLSIPEYIEGVCGQVVPGSTTPPPGFVDECGEY